MGRKWGHVVVALLIAVAGAATAVINEAGGDLATVKTGSWVIAGLAGLMAGSKEWMTLFPTDGMLFPTDGMLPQSEGGLSPWLLGVVAVLILYLAYLLVS